MDKAGRLYVRHLATVAAYTSAFAHHTPCMTALDREEAVQIAWLHDVIEDTDYGHDELIAEGFSASVVEGVEWLTKGVVCPGPSYADWIKALAEKAPLPTILVKLADVEDNSDPERLALLPEETRVRLLRKYEPAKEVLRAAARQKGWMG
ncbi:HD domain-containing protein [Methylobacterium sp. 1973]|uniref:HD domain-containing protein n=1 Tax=Methylobacterium sp. 1973 TaxID=3156421 RepID=UPI00339122ED